MQLNDGWDAVVVAGREFGIKYRHRYRVQFRLIRWWNRSRIAQNHINYLVHIGNVHLAIAVHVTIDALRANIL